MWGGRAPEGCFLGRGEIVCGDGGGQKCSLWSGKVGVGEEEYGASKDLGRILLLFCPEGSEAFPPTPGSPPLASQPWQVKWVTW